ncbi:hypothetical protein TRVA0_013S01728 [Trichomonascus vanleenenianus]|uniref:uncharacterized protein n=1 Tax=Trichomonascus vanleenenianus TaxID=2268995 RepID=UPI003ECB20BD
MLGEIPLPHGAEEYDTIDGQLVENDDFVPPSDKDERAIFSYLFRPDDCYTEEGTYWADLPRWQKYKFIYNQESSETKREAAIVWNMFKTDPLSPVRWYFRNCVLPGMGMGLEGYVLFSIGNVEPLFEAVWPQCWKDHTECNRTWVAAVTYLEITGIIFGHIVVGLIGDGLGRRFGLIQDAVIMLLGLVMLMSSWGTTLNGWVICYSWALFFYSIGVGGEYPMTATSGMEKGNSSSFKASTKDDRLHRGRKVTLAFLMQGWGQLINQVVLILLLLIFHHGSGNPPYSTVATQWTFRVAFAFPALGTLWILYHRIWKMPPQSKELEEAKKKNKVKGYDWVGLRMALRSFGPRLLATAGTWFASNVFFYGNKLFQGQFIQVLNPGSDSVMVGWLYNLINCGVSLAGYYMAAFLIDSKFYGRGRMMLVGFLMCFVLFVVPGFHFKYYTTSEHVIAFQAMYYLSSFFTQFGANCVTFLIAAEVFPTPLRATFHGVSAATGKCGALLASVLYNYIDTQTKFYFVPWFGLMGVVLTLLFLPDTTGLDLKEQDRRWQFIREGRGDDYHGVAIHPRHLSVWERLLGVGKNYNPEFDYKQKVDEMRKDWMEKQRAKWLEPDCNDSNSDLEDDFPHEVHNYFHRTSPMILPQQKRGSSEKMTPMVLPENATMDMPSIALPENATSEKQ